MDFNKIINRVNTNCYKWSSEDQIPMSIADMDFEVAEEILCAMQKRLEHKVFGYGYAPDEYFESYCNWWKKRHNFIIEKEWLMFSIGVVASIATAVRVFTEVNDNVLIQSPVYNMFHNCILNNNRNIVSNDLVYKEGKYYIDFVDLENKLKDEKTKLFILCNPHNPVGKLWSKEDLERIGKLCEKYNVLVLSDEIHCDIVKPGLGYIPYASVNECNKMNSITCIAPTKTFNIASLQTSCVFVPNEKIREKMQKGLSCDDNEGGNAFSYTPVIEAYNKCEYWVDEMLEYVWHNRELVKDYIRKEIPEIEYVEGEATYLVWLDCSSVVSDSVDFTNFLNKELKLTFNSGKRYGEQGKHFVRVNIACPECVVLEGLKRLKKGIEIYRK